MGIGDWAQSPIPNPQSPKEKNISCIKYNKYKLVINITNILHLIFNILYLVINKKMGVKSSSVSSGGGGSAMNNNKAKEPKVESINFKSTVKWFQEVILILYM